MHRSKNNRSKFLLIPIETKVRELTAKFFLSCVAAENGFNVIIGGKQLVIGLMKYLPKGIFLDKGAGSPHAKLFSYYKSIGGRIVALDEEGLLINYNQYLNYSRGSKEALKHADLFFAWGKKDSYLWSLKEEGYSSKIVLAGNPRIDLLRPEVRGIFNEDVETLANIYSPFILINTNFAPYNFKSGANNYLKYLLSTNKIKDKDSEAFFLEKIEHYNQLFHSFVEMIRKLSRMFNNHTFIVRPHPSENHQTWESIFKKHNNVIVRHEGNVVPWILASEAVIHNSCTTGIESFLLNVPVISYRPIVSDYYDKKLPNELSIQAFNLKELITLLEKIIQGSNIEEPIFQLNKKKDIVKEYISNIDGPFSCDIIIQSLQKLKSIPTYNNNYIKTFIKPYIQLIGKALTLRNKIRYLNVKKKKNIYQKFPGINRSEMESLLNNIRNTTNRFSDIMVNPIGEHGLIISKKNNRSML